MGTSLTDNSSMQDQLETLKETIEEWKAARKQEIAEDVVFLSSIDVSIAALSEAASSDALDEAVAVVSSLTAVTPD
tara:strand:- start:471 stop:698 length:228 start_codon:yes stop_codon:yes gene_type:complete